MFQRWLPRFLHESRCKPLRLDRSNWAGGSRERRKPRIRASTGLSKSRATMIADHHDIAALEPITDQEFVLFQHLIYGEAGIHWAPYKKALLEARLSKHIRELGLPSFGAYFQYVAKGQRGDE